MSIKTLVRQNAVKVVAASTALVAGVASAEPAAGIADAIAAGSENVGAVTAGVIALAALGFGLTMIVSWLRK
ncbi:hypothetical protein [Vibrio porteresiae]|uniref:Uncharacterized protein n=1 Tax=Vibrio porteresiae DSM 19223 TaxID=1123496 RepID=A0ABZ0Q7Y2_9VIBR|nr:hypothetical protein [Vibrio porteresiae]WPC72553.1 hypothetical protein R8Z52_10445 [Vibrio porteresiae DSM 19223]